MRAGAVYGYLFYYGADGPWKTQRSRVLITTRGGVPGGYATKILWHVRGIFWGDYQARIDLLNFYNTHPMAEMALPTQYEPVVRLVEIGQMLEHAMYRHIRLNFYRLHCQFVSGNDKRASYDYFMLVCGPVSAKSQTLAADGALSMITENGEQSADQPPALLQRTAD